MAGSRRLRRRSARAPSPRTPQLRLTEDEAQYLRTAAAGAGVSLNAYILDVVDGPCAAGRGHSRCREALGGTRGLIALLANTPRQSAAIVMHAQGSDNPPRSHAPALTSRPQRPLHDAGTLQACRSHSGCAAFLVRLLGAGRRQRNLSRGSLLRQ
jgi:hypothetical protein